MSAAEAPLTWLDVARRLAKSNARAAARTVGLARARVGWFGVLRRASMKVSWLAGSKRYFLVVSTRLRFVSPLRGPTRQQSYLSN